MSRRRRQALAIVAIVAAGLAIAMLIPGIRHLIVSSNNERAFALMNHDRTANSPYPALVHQSQLQAYAQNWSNHMARTHTLEHDSIQNHICCYDALGENVGAGSTLDAIEQAFMHSPEHRHNILYPSFTQAGVGVTWDSRDHVFYVTQAFRDPKRSSATSRSRPRAAPRRTSRPRAASTPRPTRTPSPSPSPSRSPTPSPSPTVLEPTPLPTARAAPPHHHHSPWRWVLVALLAAITAGAAVFLIAREERR